MEKHLEANKPIAVIVGGGPAGLTAAYELASSGKIRPVVFEETGKIGGISRTENHNGNRIDIGGHRFFSKSQRVTQWWNQIMPTGADAASTDRAMMVRPRVSRIYYLRRFFDYPVKMSLQTIRNLGLSLTAKAGFSYLKSAMKKRPENTLEDFYINRFGKTLYSMFFEDYTEKVWGVHPSKLGADWGAQRVKGLSLTGVLKDMLLKKITSGNRKGKVETSLIEEFLYPKYGPGQLWETVAAELPGKGARLELNTAVRKIHIHNNRVASVTIQDTDGNSHKVECDYLLSSMPIKDLIASLDGIEIPAEIREAAQNLPYRDFITVGLLVDKLKLRNQTRIETYKNRIPDTWIYVQESEVRLGRIQIFNNWSPYMVADNENKMWIGLEYFCTEGDHMWDMSDQEFIDLAIDELVKIDIIDREDVEDAVRIRVKKAYPAYYGTYSQLPQIRAFLDTIPNLYCIGRNGQHRYNNMDHSMLTAMEATTSILTNITAPNTTPDKTPIWNVNTETEYHETTT